MTKSCATAQPRGGDRDWSAIACSNNRPPAPARAGARAAEHQRRSGRAKDTLSLIAWAGYTEDGQRAYDWVKPFEQDTGCKVNVKYGTRSDDMVTLMRQGGGTLTTACRRPATPRTG